MGGSGDLHYNGSWIVQRSVEMKKPIVSPVRFILAYSLRILI
jgi:hypothetical protein